MAHTYIPNNRNENTIQYPLILQIMTILLYPAYEYFAEATGDDEWNCVFYNLIADLAFEFHALYCNTEWETTSRDYMLHFIESRLPDLKEKYDITRDNVNKIREYLHLREEYIG